MTRGTTERAERAFAIGFWGNTALAITKLLVGWLTGSRALLADGWHSLSDILTNAGAWFAHRWSKRPPDDDHHYGHGNFEALSGASVGLLLMAGGIAVIWGAVTSDAELAPGARGIVALVVAVISIVANLGLGWVTVRAAKESASHGLRALARDNLSDALAGGLVVLGILGSREGWVWAEPLAAVLIGLLIVWMGYRSARSGLDVLMDRVDDPTMRGKIRSLAEEIGGVREVTEVRIHPLGATYRVDMIVCVDGSLTVEEGHEIAHAADRAVRDGLTAVDEVHVHVNPWRLEHEPSPADPASERPAARRLDVIREVASEPEPEPEATPAPDLATEGSHPKLDGDSPPPDPVA